MNLILLIEVGLDPPESDKKMNSDIVSGVMVAIIFALIFFFWWIPVYFIGKIVCQFKYDLTHGSDKLCNGDYTYSP